MKKFRKYFFSALFSAGALCSIPLISSCKENENDGFAAKWDGLGAKDIEIDYSLYNSEESSKEYITKNKLIFDYKGDEINYEDAAKAKRITYKIFSDTPYNFDLTINEDGKLVFSNILSKTNLTHFYIRFFYWIDLDLPFTKDNVATFDLKGFSFNIYDFIQVKLNGNNPNIVIPVNTPVGTVINEWSLTAYYEGVKQNSFEEQQLKVEIIDKQTPDSPCHPLQNLSFNNSGQLYLTGSLSPGDDHIQNREFEVKLYKEVGGAKEYSNALVLYLSISSN